jgi:galactose mutarotase-like enzyme
MLIKGNVRGHTAVWLENEFLRLGVLPDKGADIFEFTCRPDGLQLLMESPAGLRPPSGKPPVDFLENYEGAWQELFPNHGDACEVQGQTIPMHGEVALLPWEVRQMRENAVETVLHLQVRCRKTPFLLERIMRLRAGEAKLEILEKVTNESDRPCAFVWGHHVTLGEAFLKDGSRLEVAAKTIRTPDPVYEPKTARLAAGQEGRWPLARGQGGQPVDLQLIPGRQAHSHDDAYLGGLERGHYSVSSPRAGLRFSLDWDEKVFPWVVLWQPYGGAELPPLTGMYGVGIEPWVSRFPLAEAVRKGEARTLGGGQSLETGLEASVERL